MLDQGTINGTDTVMNRVFPSMQGGSIQITLTVPLIPLITLTTVMLSNKNLMDLF